MSTVKIRKCQKEDIVNLFGIFKTVYKFNPRLQEQDYFDWQFKGSPYNEEGDYTFFLLELGNKINGFIGYLPLEFSFNNRIYKGCCPFSWFSFTKDASTIILLNKLISDFGNIYLIGFTDEAKRIYECYRMPLLEDMPRWIAVLDRNKLKSIFQIEDSCTVINKFKDCNQSLINEDITDVYRCVNFSPEEEFLLDQWKSIKYYSRRSGKYLNWRYIDIPKHNYQALRDDLGQIAVYRIENIMGHKENVLRILEWTFKGDDAKKAISLIVREAQDKGCILMDFFCTAEEIGKELEEFCFFREDVYGSMIPYLFRPIHFAEGIRVAIGIPPHRQERHLNFNEWYITKGDSDIDRVKL